MDQPKSDFNTFSEGLNKLKLKKNTKKQEAIIQPKITEAPTTVHGNFSELEKLLMQLKNTNTNIKEELGANINVNNNFNINFNNNINIQTVEKVKPSEVIEKKQIDGGKNLSPESLEEVKVDDIPEADEINIGNIDDPMQKNQNEENDKNNNFGFSPIEKMNISDIKGNNTTVAKNEDQEEYNDIKKFISNNQEREDHNKLAIINDIFDDSFNEVKHQEKMPKIENSKNKIDKEEVMASNPAQHFTSNVNNFKREKIHSNRQLNTLNSIEKINVQEVTNKDENSFDDEIKEKKSDTKNKKDELTGLDDIIPSNMNQVKEEESNSKFLKSRINSNGINESLLDPVNLQNEIVEISNNKELQRTELYDLNVEDIEIKEVEEIDDNIRISQGVASNRIDNKIENFRESKLEQNEKIYDYNNSKSSNQVLKKSFTFKSEKDKHKQEKDLININNVHNLENLNNHNQDNNYHNNNSNFINNTDNLSSARANLKNSFAENLEKIETSNCKDYSINGNKNITSDSLLNKSKLEKEVLNSTSPVKPVENILPVEKFAISAKSMLDKQENLYEIKINPSIDNKPIEENFFPTKVSRTPTFEDPKHNLNDMQILNDINQNLLTDNQNFIINESNILANNDPARESLIFDPKEILEFNEQDSKYLDRKASHKEAHFMKVGSDTLLQQLNYRNSTFKETDRDPYFAREYGIEGPYANEASFSLKKKNIEVNEGNNVLANKSLVQDSKKDLVIVKKEKVEKKSEENLEDENKKFVNANPNNNFFANVNEAKPQNLQNLQNTLQTSVNVNENKSSIPLSRINQENHNDIKNENKVNFNFASEQDNDFIFEDAIEEIPILDQPNKIEPVKNTQNAQNIQNTKTNLSGLSNNIQTSDHLEDKPLLKEKEILNNGINTSKPNEHVNTMDAFFGSDNLDNSRANKVKSHNKSDIVKDEKQYSSLSPNLDVKEKEALLKEPINSYNQNEELYKKKLNKIEDKKILESKDKIELNTDKQVHLNPPPISFRNEEKIKSTKEKEIPKNNQNFVSNNNQYLSNNYNSHNNLLTTEENVPLKQEESVNYDLKDVKKLILSEKEETHYNETVNDFSSIFKEKNYMFLKRRASLISNDYFKDYILKEYNIVDKHKKLPHNYPDILEEGLNSFLRESEFHSIFQDVIGDDNNNKAEVLKLLEETKYRNSSLVGKLKPIQNFLEKYNIIDKDPEIEENTKKESSAWREIKCDGDSFYRTFMFGLFEYYILNQNIHEIKKLVLDIYRINKNPRATIFKSRNIDFNKALVIFYLIIEHISNNNTERAYDTFLKAYALEDNSFDLILVGYMRLILWLNVAELDKQAMKIKKQLTKSLTNNGKSNAPQKEYEEVNIDTFLVYQNEPCKLALSLIPLVFNANVEVYVYDGSINRNKNTLFYTKQKFSLNALDNLPVISLGYNLSSYSKFYPINFYQKFKNTFRSYLDNSKLSKSFIVGKEEICEKCNGKFVSLIFVQHNLSICKECLKKSIEVTMEKRSIIFNKENFINREYYARQIEIKENIFIDENDIFYLFDTNLTFMLLENIRKMCFSCDKIFKEGLVNLDCSCQMCKECLNKYISQATNGEMVLNKFEQKRVNPVACCCNLPFNVESALKIISQTNREYKDRALKRLELYASHICMRCTVPLRDENEGMEVKSSTETYHVLKISFNETNRGGEKEIAKTNHLICISCIDKIYKHDKSEALKKKKMGANINIPPNFKYVQCKICDEEHAVDVKEWNKIFKVACCSQCVIY